jgi:hypothetical protein
MAVLQKPPASEQRSMPLKKEKFFFHFTTT